MEKSVKLKVVSLNLTTGIVKKYPLLTDINLQIFTGEKIAIIGHSGCGKTTLLRLLNRLIDPSSGNLYIDDQNYKQIPVISLRRKIMLIPQEPKLLDMNVKTAICYPLILQKIPENMIEEKLNIWREKLHIPEDWLNKTEVQLSLGQRQLVAIARGLITEPEVILLDEPTSALDQGRISNLLKILTEICAEKQTTIIMVTHQLNIAEIFADRVLYLESGCIVEDEKASEINWEKIKQRLIELETEINQEWE
ncbi:MAG TPA: ATP-binding cassette domain-containing protein [Allocoleopsis sp.]